LPWYNRPENRPRSGAEHEVQKGQSGNPGGRPKGYGELRELARQHTEDAIATLAEICRNGENEGARIAAANALLDRGWGKPAFSVLARDPPEVITLDFGFQRKSLATPEQDRGTNPDCAVLAPTASTLRVLVAPAGDIHKREE
jgi:hypothetical protein